MPSLNGAEEQQRRLRLVIGRRFISALRNYAHLSLVVEGNEHDNEFGHADVIIHSFNFFSNPSQIQQFVQLLLAVRDTEVPVMFEIAYWTTNSMATPATARAGWYMPASEEISSRGIRNRRCLPLPSRIAELHE